MKVKLCPHGHKNDALAPVCRTCHEPLDQVQPVEAPEPDVGRAARPTAAPGSVARPSSTPALVLEGPASSGFQARIVDEAVVGRGADVDVTRLDPGLHVSRRQARLFHADGRWWLEHLGAMNDTLIGGARLAAGRPVIVENGDRLTFAALELVARIEP